MRTRRPVLVMVVAASAAGLFGGVGLPAASALAVPAAQASASPGLVNTDVAGTSTLSGVGCASAGCVAIGDDTMPDGTSNGVVVPVQKGAAGQAQAVAGTDHLFGVSCVADGSCLAVGDAATTVNGVIEDVAAIVPLRIGSDASVTAGRVSEVSPLGYLDEVACVSDSQCVAVESENGGSGNPMVVPVANGQAGSPVAVPAGGYSPAVGCSADTCWLTVERATGSGGIVYAVNLSSAALEQTDQTSEFSPIAFACPVAEQCVVAGGFESTQAATRPMTGGKLASTWWSDAANSPLFAVACESVTLCVGLGPTPTPILADGRYLGTGDQSKAQYRAIAYAGNHNYIAVGYEPAATGEVGTFTTATLPPPVNTNLSCQAPKRVKKGKKFIITVRLTDAATGAGVNGQSIQYSYRLLSRTGRPTGSWTTLADAAGQPLTVPTETQGGRSGVARLRATDTKPAEWRAAYLEQTLAYWPSNSPTVKVLLR